MKEIFRSIAILIGLIVAGNLIMLIPDHANGEWISYGDVGSVFSVFLGVVPMVIFILLDLDIIDVYSLPFSDLLDHCMTYVVYILAMIASICWSCFDSAITNAISFILTVFITLFPLYLFYDFIVRVKLRVKNKFINYYLAATVFGGILVLSIAAAYLLASSGIYLPGDLYLSLGLESYLDGFITIPTLYLYSFIGTVIFFLYYTISGFIARVLHPEEYKYAIYNSPEPTNNKPSTDTGRRAPVKCCKYCKHFTVDRLGYRGLYCKLSGADASEYSSCDYFQE